MYVQANAGTWNVVGGAVNEGNTISANGDFGIEWILLSRKILTSLVLHHIPTEVVDRQTGSMGPMISTNSSKP